MNRFVDLVTDFVGVLPLIGLSDLSNRSGEDHEVGGACG
jgi:hypothetical protein